MIKSTPLKRAIKTISVSENERFVDVYQRIQNCQTSDLDGYSRICSQGVRDCFCWRGSPLFKSIQDMAIYNMLLNELNPGTIIEIGSTSTSLLWWKDMVRSLRLDTIVLGVDRVYPSDLEKEVQFIQGDVNNIEHILTYENLKFFEHPWLIIEDAHINISGVLNHFSKSMVAGDYIIIEDSLTKQEDVGQWASKNEQDFTVDTYYTDFFGINATSAVNTIITKRS